ncbi:MAG: hypothetical protein PHY34_03535 [Patescibacteria group bacterium]|nr:hypothetical protein [Patescibacteria group bacterium]MDD5715645.1 hypothetical protein [Patescibacteria group bacterium]
MKKAMIVAAVVIASTAITAGIVHAATSHNVTATLGGVSGDYFVIDGVMNVSSLKVGGQGSGGVTQFNGTILNSTTGTGGVDNPVTFGDNVRIDGRVYRGATAGAGLDDDKPFIVNDDMEVAGTLTVGGNDVPTKRVLSGSLDRTAAGDETVENDYSDTCTEEYPEGLEKYVYHYRKISIPELRVDNPMELRAFISTNAATGSLDVENLWASANYTMTDGAIYVYYKADTHLCGGSITTTYVTTGDYKIVIFD